MHELNVQMWRTIYNTDNIIVFDKGEVKKPGSQEELSKIRNGIYKKLNSIRLTLWLKKVANPVENQQPNKPYKMEALI